MSPVKKDNRLELRVTASESDPDSDFVKLIGYIKSLGKGAKPLVSKALKAFYMPLSLSTEVIDRDKLTSARAASIKSLLQQVQEILLAFEEDGTEIPEYLLLFGRNIFREQGRSQNLNSQPETILGKLETSVAGDKTSESFSESSELPRANVPVDFSHSEDEDDDPFKGMALPDDFNPDLGKIDVNL